MKHSIFRPKYSLKSFWDVITLGLLSIVSLAVSYLKSGFSPITLLILVVLVFFVVFWVCFLIRRIVFSQSTFRVERYTWPSKTIKYSDVIDLAETRIKTRRGDIIPAGMSNASELLAQFKKLIEQGLIDQNQIENKAVQQEAIYRKSLMPTFIVTLILSVLFLYFWPYSRSGINVIWLWVSLVTIFLLVMLVTHWIIKKAGYR